MSDNPYAANAASESDSAGSSKAMGRTFVVGFLVLALGEILKVSVRFISPSILSDLMTAPAGVKPSEIARQFQMWSFVSALGSVASLVGVALLLYAVWKRLAVRINET